MHTVDFDQDLFCLGTLENLKYIESCIYIKFSPSYAYVKQHYFSTIPITLKKSLQVIHYLNIFVLQTRIGGGHIIYFESTQKFNMIATTTIISIIDLKQSGMKINAQFTV